MNTSEIIVGLDIGTTKICVLVGKKNMYGKIELLGMGKAPSYGVKRGVVSNIYQTVNSIEMAVKEAEKKSGVSIKRVNVGIAGQHIRSYQNRGNTIRDKVEEEISSQDVEKLRNDMYKITFSAGEKIIHVLPQEYVVNGESGIKDPIGMSGERLEATYHIITGQVNSIQNIEKCIRKAGLEVADMTLEPLASAAAVLSEEEKEAGVALVDIGGGTTDIAIFQDGIIRHTHVIPFGGDIITEDIKEGCSVLRNHAEELKVKFGSALASQAKENEIVSIPGLMGREPKEISVKNLAQIIEARMKEILDFVCVEIKRSSYEKKLIGGIVITGGGAQLKHIEQLVAYTTGMDVRIGYPTQHLAKGMVDEIKNPMYATGIGLILEGKPEMIEEKTEIVPEPEEAADHDEPKAEVNKPMPWYKSFFQRGKEFLEKDMPNEF